MSSPRMGHRVALMRHARGSTPVAREARRRTAALDAYPGGVRRIALAITAPLVAAAAVACAHHAAPPATGRLPGSACFEGQVRIESFCIDQYEAYVVELDAAGNEHPHSPYDVI